MCLELLLWISCHESIQIEQCIYWISKRNTVPEAVLRRWRKQCDGGSDSDDNSSDNGESPAQSWQKRLPDVGFSLP